MSCYLCYDVKGIQQFIFSVPQLKYVVGGSLLIYEFDTKRVVQAAQSAGLTSVAKIFSGGGRGTFKCESRDQAEHLRSYLVTAAMEIGLDLRIGIDKDLSQAIHTADDLYPFIPESLEGEPCRVSGLWPTTLEESKGYREENRGIHKLIWERRNRAIQRDETGRNNADALSQSIVADLKKLGSLPEDLRKRELIMLRAVRPELQDEARAADAALGKRNRWAVVAMDGNDMGSQFRVFSQEHNGQPHEHFERWMQAMSCSLEHCTRQAFLEALAEAVTNWWKDSVADGKLDDAITEDGRVVLPFRPLILGGDDVVCICHVSYAMRFAETLARRFNELSREESNQVKGKGIDVLWPATGGELTISAGIAFTGVTLPLYTSIHYAESLLASAKGGFRSEGGDGRPTPAAVDWENITETMLDTPAARRARELRFYDGDLDGMEIVLTNRPYKIGKELADLHQLAERLDREEKVPRSLLAEAVFQLRKPWAQRTRWITSIAKHNRFLFEQLNEIEDLCEKDREKRSWSQTEKEGKRVRTTRFVDAVSLLDESHRMTQETVD